jgi:hypothetical protein
LDTITRLPAATTIQHTPLDNKQQPTRNGVVRCPCPVLLHILAACDGPPAPAPGPAPAVTLHGGGRRRSRTRCPLLERKIMDGLCDSSLTPRLARSGGTYSRKHACWMSGSPEARVAPEASGIGESSRSRLSRSTRSYPIHCHGSFARSRSSSCSVPRHGLVSSLVHRRHHRHGVSRSPRNHRSAIPQPRSATHHRSSRQDDQRRDRHLLVGHLRPHLHAQPLPLIYTHSHILCSPSSSAPS